MSERNRESEKSGSRQTKRRWLVDYRGDGGSKIQAVVELCRPRQWVKNAFVVAPLAFSESYTRLDALAASGAALVAFCLWSSVVYVINDLLDREADRAHPRKKRRPLARGAITASEAIATLVVLLTVAVGVALASLPLSFLLIGGLYLANSLAYCLVLKHKVIVDVLSICIGFELRLLAGCEAIDVEASSWILVCGFALAMLLGFGKRRTELPNSGSADYRLTLVSYSEAKLDSLLAVSAALCLMSYMLYTIAPETQALHGTGQQLLFSVPFVAYGVFRYMFKVQEGKGDGPVEILTSDPVFAVNGALWMATVLLILATCKS